MTKVPIGVVIKKRIADLLKKRDYGEACFVHDIYHVIKEREEIELNIKEVTTVNAFLDILNR